MSFLFLRFARRKTLDPRVRKDDSKEKKTLDPRSGLGIVNVQSFVDRMKDYSKGTGQVKVVLFLPFVRGGEAR